MLSKKWTKLSRASFFHGNPKRKLESLLPREMQLFFWLFLAASKRIFRESLSRYNVVFMQGVYEEWLEREGKKSLSSVQSGGVFFFANICPSRERHILFLQVFVPNGYCYFGKDSSKLSLTRDE